MSKLRKLFNKSQPVKLEEPTKRRSVAEIQQEYADLCARMGNINYQIWILESDLLLLQNRARALNNEGAQAKQQEALETSQKAEAPQPQESANV